MTSDKTESQRQYYRLKFPHGEELTARINGKPYLVSEIAEQSIELTKPCTSDKNGVCEGTIEWSDGSTSVFGGMVDRLLASKRVIVGVYGIALADIVKEQRRLISKYPL